MYKKISYKVRFPLGGKFDIDPKIILLRNIYREIKKCSCLNIEYKCYNCDFNDKCIYYYLSGHNFQEYPGINVDGTFMGKTDFKRNDVFDVSFYAIGNCAKYFEFIKEYMSTHDYINNVLFQKVVIKEEVINSNEVYNGKIIYKSIVKDLDDINKCINYYNNFYKTNYLIPEFTLIDKPLEFNDYREYIFNGRRIKVSGIIYNANVCNYQQELLDIGVGSYAFLGGGKN